MSILERLKGVYVWRFRSPVCFFYSPDLIDFLCNFFSAPALIVNITRYLLPYFLDKSKFHNLVARIYIYILGGGGGGRIVFFLSW